MIHGNNIRVEDVVGVMMLVLITTMTKNRATFAAYFRITSTAIKHPCITKRTNTNIVATQ